jgi:hypothetical protein
LTELLLISVKQIFPYRHNSKQQKAVRFRHQKTNGSQKTFVFVQETFFSAFLVLHIRDFILESTVVSLYPVAVVIADNFLMSRKNITDKKNYVKPIIGISACPIHSLPNRLHSSASNLSSK